MPRASSLQLRAAMPRARRTWTVLFVLAHHFLYLPRSTTRRVVHERNGREGQRRLRALNSARWNIFRSAGRLPVFELLERKLGPKSVTSTMNSYRLLNSRRPLVPNQQRIFCNSGSPREADSLVFPNGVKPADQPNHQAPSRGQTWSDKSGPGRGRGATAIG